MREIFFEEKLGETQRNSEGERAARAEMGCEPHRQGWIFGGGILGEKLGGTLRHSERLGVRVVMEV